MTSFWRYNDVIIVWCVCWEQAAWVRWMIGKAGHLIKHSFSKRTAIFSPIKKHSWIVWRHIITCSWMPKCSSSWWRHQMETFSSLLALCVGNSSVTDEFLSQRPVTWRGTLMFSLICAWTKYWTNNRNASDLRRHRVHYDVTVIWQGMIALFDIHS